jgi:16S rRNA (guanine527-N7)-methyltransferase
VSLPGQVAARLAALAAGYGLDPAVAERLAAVLELVAGDDRAPTAVREPADAVDVHVADSLSGLEVPALRSAGRIADLGAGAGFPGIVLAAALPGSWVALVESQARKCAFLRDAVAAAGLSNAEVVHARAEDWQAGLGACDAVTARAVAPLAVLAEYAAPLLAPGGVLVAWKGAPDPAEAAAGAAAARALGLAGDDPLPVTPFDAAERRSLYVYCKVRETPPGFPRRPGIARKRPLSR